LANFGNRALADFGLRYTFRKAISMLTNVTDGVMRRTRINEPSSMAHFAGRKVTPGVGQAGKFLQNSDRRVESYF